MGLHSLLEFASSDHLSNYYVWHFIFDSLFQPLRILIVIYQYKLLLSHLFQATYSSESNHLNLIIMYP